MALFSDHFFVSVTDPAYGAVGDGVNDDTAEIQAAITRCDNLGGGIVFFPPGLYLVSAPILLPSGVYLMGASRTSSQIKLANSVNFNMTTNFGVIQTDNFATQTGMNKWTVDTDSVRYDFGLFNLDIDANKGNNTTGHGVAFYGKNYKVDNVSVRQAANDGFYSEAGDTVGSPNNLADMPETQIGRIWVRSSGGVGFRYRGPHDGYAASVIVVGSADDNISIEQSPNVYSGTIEIAHAHVYSNSAAGGRGIDINDKCRLGVIVAETGGAENCRINNHHIQINTLFCYLGNNQNTAGEIYSVMINGDENQINNLRIHGNANNAGGLYVDGNYNKVRGFIERAAGTRASASGFRLAGNYNDIDLTIKDWNQTTQDAMALGFNRASAAGSPVTIRGNRVRGTLINNLLGVRVNPNGVLNSIIEIGAEVNAGHSMTSGTRSTTSSWRMAWRDNGGVTDEIINEQPVST